MADNGEKETATTSKSSSPPVDFESSAKSKGKTKEPARKPIVIKQAKAGQPIAPSISAAATTTMNDPDQPSAKRLKFADPIETTSTKKDTPKKSREDLPPIGSERWKELKRASHSQVERRRRDNITDCINELAKLVPTERRQKEATLRAAVDFIKGAKEQHDVNIRKWTLDRIVSDQAVRQLEEQVEIYKAKYEKLRKAVQDAGHGDLCVDSDTEKEPSPAL